MNTKSVSLSEILLNRDQAHDFILFVNPQAIFKSQGLFVKTKESDTTSVPIMQAILIIYRCHKYFRGSLIIFRLSV